MPEEPADRYNEIIRILGEDRIEQLFFLIGPQKFSLAKAKNIIRQKKVLNLIKDGVPFRKIRQQLGCGKTTIYRYSKSFRKK